jgi:hypothetical protein
MGKCVRLNAEKNQKRDERARGAIPELGGRVHVVAVHNALESSRNQGQEPEWIRVD